MRFVFSICLIALFHPHHTAFAQLDQDKLVQAYKAFDSERNEGKGFSESADSGSLGWGEGGVLQDYVRLWEVTEDPYWLAKIRDHFKRIMKNASDPDGDGFLGWATTTYSSAVAYAERLHNVSDATIEPAVQKNRTGKAAATCTGHSYLIEFQKGADQFRVVDWDTRKVVAADVVFKDGAKIAAIKPFRFVIRGKPHQGDRFLVRTVAPEPLEFAVHQGMFVYPAAVFIEAVKSRSELQSQFAGDADAFLTFINKHVFEKFERDWLDMGERGGGYRFEPKVTDRYPNRIMPHNQYAALARAWLVLKDVPGADPRMKGRAEAMVRYFHSHLEPVEEKDAYRWHYWDWIEYGKPDHSRYEDTSHAALNVALAVEAARRGVIFTDEDMKRIANTWLELMWNHDEKKPQMASDVAGGGEHRFSPTKNRWTMLSQWNPKVRELAETAFEAMGDAGRAKNAPAILLCVKRAGEGNNTPARKEQ